jgi:outer membrane receptor protein involved in Fe transport
MVTLVRSGARRSPFLHATLVAALTLAGAAPAARADDFTGVRGTVTDAKTGEALIEATVKVVKGGTQSVLTDLDGHYELALPPGTYELRIFYDIYQPRRISGVVIAKGEVRTIDAALSTDVAAVEEVVVEAKVDKNTETGLLVERKKAATVSDSVSAEEIKRTPDASASEAVKRVVSATVSEGKYVFVRGLGGRYGTTLLNGAILPSPEPDEPAVPLDLFPAALLANLKVVKSYSVDLPGSFSGGALIIATSTYPGKLEGRLKLTLSGDSEATFRDMPHYAGGKLDFLGVDDGTRALPPDVPRNRPAEIGEADIDAAAIEDIGEAFHNDWAHGTRLALPGIGLGGTIGGTTKLAGHKLGWIATLSYGHKDKIRRSEVTKLGTSDAGLIETETVSNILGDEAVNAGALLAAGLDLAKGNTLHFVSLFTHAADASTLLVSGYNANDGLDLEGARLRWVTRTMSFEQLGGEHTFASLHNLTISWLGTFGLTARDEPDTRDLKYSRLEDGRLRFRAEPNSGERFYSTLFDKTGGGRLDVSVPFKVVTFHAGGAVDYTFRRFSARHFRYDFIGTDVATLFLPAEELFTEETIGPDFRLAEKTLQSDAYSASILIAAAYASVEVELGPKVRLVGGLRWEMAHQLLDPGSPFAIVETKEETVDRSDSDFLPSLNLVYGVRDNMNFRLGYSYTLARPKFRELAPFLFFDYERRRSVGGNPALLETRIHNADLRWELFPSERSVVSTSVFYKRFSNPIEQVIVNPASGDVGYANALGADLFGLEVEARTSFSFLTPKLADFFVAVNLAYVESEVAIDPLKARSSTSLVRPLQGQSPLVFNLGLGWETEKTDVWLLFNLQGKRLSEVGFERLPDVFEKPFHRLDITAGRSLGGGLRLKVAATNLLNRPVVLEQGDVTVYRYRPGVAATISLELTR